MATLQTQGIELHYELLGDAAKPPLLLIAGLGGMGASWGSQVERFARHYRVILPDQRGTGRTTHAEGGYTTSQLAADFASLVEALGTGPVHVVGTSTGGAIGQYMALNHANTVRSLTIASSFARFDDWLNREFQLRRMLVRDADPRAIYDCYALFLFSPAYTRANPQRVSAWVDRCVAAPFDREISLKRIDMIAGHDAWARLGELCCPTLVLGGSHDVCVPPALSEELAAAIPGAERVRLETGHMAHDEAPEQFFEAVHGFLGRQRAATSE